MTCQVSGCEGVTLAQGYCQRHYFRWRRHGDVTAVRQRGSSNPYGAQMMRRVRQLERNRARSHGHIERLRPVDVDAVAMLLRDPCAYCGAEGGQIDHIDAHGSSECDNLTAACVSCNTAKQQLPALRFLLGQRIRRLRGRLDVELAECQPETFTRMRQLESRVRGG